MQTWPLPLWTSWRSRTVQGVMFVGDAGSFINAITGGGIYTAMVTGQLAAQQALHVIDGTTPDQPYDMAWHPAVGKSLRTAHLIQRYVAPSALLFDTVLAIASLKPVRHPLLKALSGEHY